MALAEVLHGDDEGDWQPSDPACRGWDDEDYWRPGGKDRVFIVAGGAGPAMDDYEAYCEWKGITPARRKIVRQVPGPASGAGPWGVER